MGVRAADGNLEQPAGQHVAGRRAAADVGRAAGRDAAVDALCSSQPELQHRLAGGGLADACRLGRDQRLKVYQRQQGRLQELALQQRTAHPQQRLVREADGSFGQGVDIAREPQAAEVIEKRRLEERFVIGSVEGRQKCHVLRRETELPAVVDHAGQSAGNAEAARKRMLAERELKDGFVGQPARLPVAIGHGELIEVGQQGERLAVEGERSGHGAFQSSVAKTQADTVRLLTPGS